ncbi:hypothetical protein EZV62_001376 [Acer yangbiense]|uniref:Protein ENHANCED DISEASE RESISTANCE 2 C-terminal domain-containing protein n=1 Tax=Acer yangbiense TaxID=1000413 RepID=A0A5C7ITY2_9ROSI|nr:hypothetical protein EZV62_001376 [Acer yangbiense]
MLCMKQILAVVSVKKMEPFFNCVCGHVTDYGMTYSYRSPSYNTECVTTFGSVSLFLSLGFLENWGFNKIKFILSSIDSSVRSLFIRAIQDEFTGDKPFVWAFNIQVPNKDNFSAIAYFVATKPAPEGSLMDQFLKGDDNFRNSRLKLIANVVQGPWIVRKAVGEQAICIIGRALSCKYCIGENFLEVDVDIGSSMMANAIVHLALGYITTLTVDLAFVIEGQTESELPEQLLGAFRFSQLNPASAQLIEPASYGSTGGLQSSLSIRLWKSIGHGFSSLLNPSVQESGSDSANVNGSVHGDSSVDIKKW